MRVENNILHNLIFSSNHLYGDRSSWSHSVGDQQGHAKLGTRLASHTQKWYAYEAYCFCFKCFSFISSFAVMNSHAIFLKINILLAVKITPHFEWQHTASFWFQTWLLALNTSSSVMHFFHHKLQVFTCVRYNRYLICLFLCYQAVSWREIHVWLKGKNQERQKQERASNGSNVNQSTQVLLFCTTACPWNLNIQIYMMTQ